MGIQRSSKGEANTSFSSNTKVKRTWMYLFSFAARRHQYRGFWKDETPISHLAGKEIWRWRKAFWNTGCFQIYTVLCIGTMPSSPQETQLLQGTAVCVLNTSDIHMHVKLISALCTGFPCSNSSSQSLFPCCPVACPENGKGHSLGCWTALSVRFLRHWGAFYHKPFSLRGFRTSVSPSWRTGVQEG